MISEVKIRSAKVPHVLTIGLMSVACDWQNRCAAPLRDHDYAGVRLPQPTVSTPGAFRRQRQDTPLLQGLDRAAQSDRIGLSSCDRDGPRHVKQHVIETAVPGLLFDEHRKRTGVKVGVQYWDLHEVDVIGNQNQRA
jgi:hypothetical protein